MIYLDTILLIDDNEADNYFHERILRKLQAAEQIVPCHYSTVAIEMLRNETVRPDLILLDINMPRSNGWEFLTEYKSLPASIRQSIQIAVLSTSQNPEDKSRAEDLLGEGHFIAKPLCKESYSALVNRLFSA